MVNFFFVFFCFLILCDCPGGRVIFVHCTVGVLVCFCSLQRVVSHGHYYSSTSRPFRHFFFLFWNLHLDILYWERLGFFYFWHIWRLKSRNVLS